MEKTIEQQIADGIAQGIQKAKEQEAELRKQKAKEKGAGIVLFFLTWFLTIITFFVIRDIFGMSKEFVHHYSYPFIALIELGFMIFFLKEDFKTHFFGSLVVTLFNAFGIGYIISTGF